MFNRSLVAAGLLCLANTAAHADTLLLDSFGTGSTASGAVNSSVTYTAYNGSPVASGTTYNVGTGGVWHDPLGGSTWVSFGPDNYPGGSVQATDGHYTYESTFTDSLASTGSISVLADDTVTVYLNGNLVGSAATSDPAAHCTVGTPNCLTPVTFDLLSSDFVTGENVLQFVVDQDFHYATGLDFTGSVQTGVTPEPSSFLLLGTGLLGAAGVLKKRYVA